jgi:hypothetical protein
LPTPPTIEIVAHDAKSAFSARRYANADWVKIEMLKLLACAPCQNCSANPNNIKGFIRIMAAIEKIAIEVSSEVAEAYRNATETERLHIATRIGWMLRSATGSRQEAIDRLKQTMDEIGNEAAEAGLTPEILESILNDP